MRQPEERSAVLVIRVWRETSGPGDVVRARLTQTPDAAAPGWEQSAAAGEEQILDAVGAWLEAFAAQ